MEDATLLWIVPVFVAALAVYVYDWARKRIAAIKARDMFVERFVTESLELIGDPEVPETAKRFLRSIARHIDDRHLANAAVASEPEEPFERRFGVWAAVEQLPPEKRSRFELTLFLFLMALSYIARSGGRMMRRRLEGNIARPRSVLVKARRVAELTT